MFANIVTIYKIINLNTLLLGATNMNILFTCKAEGLPEIVSAASLRAFEDFISPSAAITLARASRAASASAAIARCRVVGKETSFLQDIRK